VGTAPALVVVLSEVFAYGLASSPATSRSEADFTLNEGIS
jgi:hypothetical protein